MNFENLNDVEWVKSILEPLFAPLLVTGTIYMYLIHPWYICRYKQYEFEIQKAQRVSRVFWTFMTSGYTVHFDGKIDYEAIRCHMLDFICDIIMPYYIEELNQVKELEVFENSNTNMQISIIDSIFRDKIGFGLCIYYFKTYPMSDTLSRLRKELTGIKVLSDNELFDMGILKYKQQLKQVDIDYSVFDKKDVEVTNISCPIYGNKIFDMN